MLTRIHGRVQFECDMCSEVLDTEERDFETARERFKLAEWKSRALDQIKKTWLHLCPSCARKYDRENRSR